MTSRASMTIKSRLPQWLAQQDRKWDNVALTMATDTHQQASIIAPVDKGNLVASGRVERKWLAEYEVAFGGESGMVSVPYAKRRHFENFKNPQTLRYLERAGDNVAKNKRKYIKNAK